MSVPRCFALVPCAGVGSRAGGVGPKQYQPVNGQPLVWHTVRALEQVERLSAIWVVVSPDDTQFDTVLPDRSRRVRSARCGGASRAETVRNGLDALRDHGQANDDDWVLVHDAARCLVQPAWVNRLIDACLDDAVGGLLALPLTDTLKQAHDGRVQSTLSRQDKWSAQTPQMFPLGLLRTALAQIGPEVTDEASAVEALGLSPRLVRGDLCNIKVTWPEDFDLAARWLAHPG
ncbi:MAG: 2-C-methyl-D-erythritol 4-phosphate cytidylyltransferase [Leptothrix sp. (in: b-proteobacteria)]